MPTSDILFPRRKPRIFRFNTQNLRRRKQRIAFRKNMCCNCNFCGLCLDIRKSCGVKISNDILIERIKKDGNEELVEWLCIDKIIPDIAEKYTNVSLMDITAPGNLDLSVLSVFPNLTVLKINPCTVISDYSPIANCKKVSWLEIDSYPLTDGKMFAALPKLRRLLVGTDNISDFTSLYSHENLAFLRLSPASYKKIDREKFDSAGRFIDIKAFEHWNNIDSAIKV